LLNCKSCFNSRPGFEAFTYTNQAFDRFNRLSLSTRTEKLAQATFVVCILPLGVLTDLVTFSFRVIKHLNALSCYKAEGFHLNKFLEGVSH